MTEQEIFERICKGDEKTLEFLYKKYYRMMTKMVITNSGTEDEARDIYQDALIVFWQKATSGKLVMTSKISTYIYSICQNLWRKELDRKKRLSNEEKDVAVEEEEEAARVVAAAGSPERALLVQVILVLIRVQWKHFSGDGACSTMIVRHQSHMMVRGR